MKWAIFRAGVIVLLIAACNQMDTILPSDGTYRVDAINGGFSLNEYSVIAAGDTIRPYFVNPVVDDPDIRALVLYVEDSHGEILGGRIRYSPDRKPATVLKGEQVSEPAADQADQTGQALEAGAEDSTLKENGDKEEEKENDDAEGDEEDEKAGETTGSGPVLQDDDITIPVKNFAGKLPLFPLPDKLKIGAYSLVFEIRGEHTVLSRMNQPFYYIGDRKFTAGEIRYYLPEFNENSHLASPGLRVMLEAQMDYGKDLEPYIIWYNGKDKIGEGFAAEGAVRLLWTVPLRSGFHTIRAELFPAKPRAGQKGKIKEFSLPVSQKSEKGAPAAGDYLYWYRFAGDLLDVRAGKGLNIVQGDKAAPSWYPAEQVYGLALDEGERYEVPGHFLDLPEDGGGRLGFFIRVLPLKNGGIFSARLGSSLALSLSLEDGALLLELEEQDRVSRISKVLPESGRGPAFTGIFITVKLDESRVSASLALGAPDESGGSWPGMEDGDISNAALLQDPAEWAELELGMPLSGELRSWIGANPKKKPGDRENKPAAGSEAKSAVSPPVLALDDFAAMFRVFRGSPEESGEVTLAGEPAEAVPAGESAEVIDEGDGAAD